MIRPLALEEPGTLEALVALQRAAYRVEADLIGADVIPALTETPEHLAASGIAFLGAEEDGRLLAAVGYRRTGGLLDVERLVVDPAAFRRGLATALLDALDEREPGVVRTTVSTAAVNAPARALYEGRGFRAAGETEVEQGVRIVQYVR